MDAKSRAWQRLQSELKDAQPESKKPDETAALLEQIKDPKKKTLLTRLQRLADAAIAKQTPAPKAA
jgi:hypothetical protein